MLVAIRRRLATAGLPAARRIARALAPPSAIAPARLVELVATAAVALPGPTVCLPRSIAIEALLLAAGRPAALRVGIAPRPCSHGGYAVDAHAWVELDGHPLGEDVSGWLPLENVRASGAG